MVFLFNADGLAETEFQQADPPFSVILSHPTVDLRNRQDVD